MQTDCRRRDSRPRSRTLRQSNIGSGLRVFVLGTQAGTVWKRELAAQWQAVGRPYPYAAFKLKAALRRIEPPDRGVHVGPYSADAAVCEWLDRDELAWMLGHGITLALPHARQTLEHRCRFDKVGRGARVAQQLCHRVERAHRCADHVDGSTPGQCR